MSWDEWVMGTSRTQCPPDRRGLLCARAPPGMSRPSVRSRTPRHTPCGAVRMQGRRGPCASSQRWRYSRTLPIFHATVTSFTHKSIEAVAIFEAAKGAIVVAAGFGILRYAHHDVRVFAEELVELFHLNPASRYPALFIHAAENLGHMHLMTLASIGIAYASLRFAEAYGLWRERKWAEWLAAASGAIYIPVEITHL